MTFVQKFDNVLTGVISGLLFPFITGIIIYFFTHGNITLRSYIERVADSNIITQSVTLCVFPNVIIFLIFIRLDMLRTTRGVLAMTIVWAFIVFGLKLLR